MQRLNLKNPKRMNEIIKSLTTEFKFLAGVKNVDQVDLPRFLRYYKIEYQNLLSSAGIEGFFAGNTTDFFEHCLIHAASDLASFKTIQNKVKVSFNLKSRWYANVLNLTILPAENIANWQIDDDIQALLNDIKNKYTIYNPRTLARARGERIICDEDVNEEDSKNMVSLLNSDKIDCPIDSFITNPFFIAHSYFKDLSLIENADDLAEYCIYLKKEMQKFIGLNNSIPKLVIDYYINKCDVNIDRANKIKQALSHSIKCINNSAATNDELTESFQYLINVFLKFPESTLPYLNEAIEVFKKRKLFAPAWELMYRKILQNQYVEQELLDFHRYLKSLTKEDLTPIFGELTQEQFTILICQLEFCLFNKPAMEGNQISKFYTDNAAYALVKNKMLFTSNVNNNDECLFYRMDELKEAAKELIQLTRDQLTKTKNMSVEKEDNSQLNLLDVIQNLKMIMTKDDEIISLKEFIILFRQLLYYTVDTVAQVSDNLILKTIGNIHTNKNKFPGIIPYEAFNYDLDANDAQIKEFFNAAQPEKNKNENYIRLQRQNAFNNTSMRSNRDLNNNFLRNKIGMISNYSFKQLSSNSMNNASHSSSTSSSTTSNYRDTEVIATFGLLPFRSEESTSQSFNKANTSSSNSTKNGVNTNNSSSFNAEELMAFENHSCSLM